MLSQSPIQISSHSLKCCPLVEAEFVVRNGGIMEHICGLHLRGVPNEKLITLEKTLRMYKILKYVWLWQNCSPLPPTFKRPFNWEKKKKQTWSPWSLCASFLLLSSSLPALSALESLWCNSHYKKYCRIKKEMGTWKVDPTNVRSVTTSVLYFSLCIFVWLVLCTFLLWGAWKKYNKSSLKTGRQQPHHHHN